MKTFLDRWETTKVVLLPSNITPMLRTFSNNALSGGVASSLCHLCTQPRLSGEHDRSLGRWALTHGVLNFNRAAVGGFLRAPGSYKHMQASTHKHARVVHVVRMIT